MSRYTSATDADREAMLAAIGAASVDELFADIPESVRLDRAIDLPPGKPEQEVYAYLRDLARRNVSTEDEISFLGAGMYDHYVPALVDALLGRSEFLTPYTPYQPEVSQGTLQVMFEYQTAISELTGLPVSNATLYEGPSAVASAGWLAHLQNRRGRFVVSRALHPHSREALATTSAGYGKEIDELGDLDDLDAVAGGGRAQRLAAVRVDRPRHDDAALAVRDPGEVGRRGDGARPLVDARVGDRQRGQLADRRLVLEHHLQAALGDLRLVRRVRRQVLGALHEHVDDGRDVVVVHPGAEERDLVLGRHVAGRELPQVRVDVLLGQSGGQVERAPEPHPGGHLALEELIERPDADGREHLPQILRRGARVAAHERLAS